VTGLDLTGLLYEYFKDEQAKHSREPGVYWVTDLVSCSMKRWFELKYPELVLANLFNPVAVLGSLVHAGLGQLLSRILEAESARVDLEVESSLELNLESIVPGSGRAVVKGRADAIATARDGARYGIEVKTSRSDLSLPMEHHVDQVRIYNLIFNLERSYLLYVTPDRIAQYEVADRMSEEEIAKRILEAKTPRYAWECKYCPFAVLCPSKATK